MPIQHPAGSVADAIVAMQQGNPVSPPQMRDLRICKHPLLVSRSYPVQLAHWRRQELEDFLEAQRFPSHTLKDHERSRQLCVSDALRQGRWVPAEVLSEEEGQEALAHAIMTVQAQAEWLRRHTCQKEQIAAFERAIGYCVSQSAYDSATIELLEKACKDGKAYRLQRLVDGSVDGVELTDSGLDGFNRLKLAMIFSRVHSMGDSYLVIRDGVLPDVSLYGELARLPLNKVEAVMRQLITDNRLTLAQCRVLMGPYWSPHVVVTACSSAA